MDIHNLTLQPLSIVNILTLRYDPTIKPNLPVKTWEDFQSANKPLSAEFIEKSICHSIEEKLTKFDGKKISIA